MGKITFTQIHPQNFLSFGPDTEPIGLERLNVLIGPNGSGKSNFISALDVLQATAGDLAAHFRQEGGVGEYVWKGKPASNKISRISVGLDGIAPGGSVDYRLEFCEVNHRLEVVDEALEEAPTTVPSGESPFFYYRFQKGHPAINTRTPGSTVKDNRPLQRKDLDPGQSIFSQRKDPDLYPELTRTGKAFGRIASYRDWVFGRNIALRTGQPDDLSTDILLPDLSNLGLILNQMEQGSDWDTFSDYLRRFLPSFDRLSFEHRSRTLQLFLHEKGLGRSIPATRLSDGTLRFLALLGILMNPSPPSFICLEEPELGLHPDAISQLAQLLVEASKKTQLLVTTHSDALISALSETPESVLVAEKLGGTTQLRRLESEKLRHWLDKYTLGDIWRMGELGGNL